MGNGKVEREIKPADVIYRLKEKWLLVENGKKRRNSAKIQ